MYKVEISSKDSQVAVGHGYVLPEHQINTLIGKLLTLTETLGLQEKQEKSFKDIIKQAVWSNVRDMKHIDSELLTLVNNFAWEKEREEGHRQSNVNNVDAYSPREPIKGNYKLIFTEVE